ncbi:MAG: hypothetical protein IKK36_09220 [Bacteroidales bacterium]|nr:hypothetical protein [Bacteroidales bacterium]
MKRIVFAFVALFCVAAFVSCNKSGIYTPKDKLSKVWMERESSVIIDSVEQKNPPVEKFLYEGWEWDGKYLKSRTVYRANGDVRFSYNYEYNDKMKNRVVGITSSIPAERKNRIRFLYDDDSKLLKEIKYFTEYFPNSDLPYRWIEVGYDGNKVVSLKETINTQRAPHKSDMETSLLPYFVSEGMAESIAENEITSKIEYDSRINEYAIEWEKKNISHVKITTTVGGKTSEVNISYTYDKNKNPQYARVMGLIEDGDVNSLIFSHNNVASCTYESENMTYTEQCEYTYDKKVPVEKIIYRDQKTGMITSKITEKWTYEYAE